MKRTIKATKQPPSKISQTLTALGLEASFKPHPLHFSIIHQVEKLHVFHAELKDVGDVCRTQDALRHIEEKNICI